MAATARGRSAGGDGAWAATVRGRGRLEGPILFRFFFFLLLFLFFFFFFPSRFLLNRSPTAEIDRRRSIFPTIDRKRWPFDSTARSTADRYVDRLLLGDTAKGGRLRDSRFRPSTID
ncbi:hypothetical protein BHM03_00046376 [Ensete ventricosum]|nr:hypothetical protein BHM03_00046376 [Ensete ventricosum]